MHEVGVGHGSFDRDSRSEGLDRIHMKPVLLVSDAQVVLGMGAAWVQGHRPAEVADGGAEVRTAVVGQPAVVVGLEAVGVDGDGSGVLGHGAAVLAGALLPQALRLVALPRLRPAAAGRAGTPWGRRSGSGG